MVGLEEDRTSFSTLVFLTMTLHNGAFGLTVVALWMDILRAMVPATSQHPNKFVRVLD